MKKFSNINESVETKYELKDSLRNEIYSLIENSISIKISNEDSLDKDISINGKEELVEKIKSLIDDVRIKERTMTLEHVKTNVYRNFDMKWLNEQIDGLQKIKIGSDFVLKENINDAQANDQFKADALNYFAKRLNEIGNINGYDFDHDPSDGIFKFVNDRKGIVVKATPFYNDKNGIPIEVCDIKKEDTHYFIQQRAFNTEEVLFEEYFKIMSNFLIHDDEWMKKVDNANEMDDDGYHVSETPPKDTDYRNITI
jgi:hypothetical protein